ncbi:hypothetical protein GOBAR_DD00596 [Gossypium barbadense]|nr:hypothetical protein GOBAR_DD00596 [Gossypium barbadense]
MSRLGFKSMVYHGDFFLGELNTIPITDSNFQFPNNEIRIHHISPTSERCIPLSILHTISSFPVRCKLESPFPVEQPHLIHLHASCFYEFKIRDTSVLVRLRPAWDELRSYLTAKGRKRFEVYVCTMAERDYALEMWRLLDPGAHLIGSKQLLDRVVCVKSGKSINEFNYLLLHLSHGSRKSLLNVFRDGKCHPQMAMVIDDRSKVWEDKDQPRVHVVPPFAPYYAPQAETANAVPVLCVARNVACNARGLFFKEFDENVLRKMSEVFYEDEVVNLPLAPDVSNYLMSEEASFASNGNNGAPICEGMNGAEVERRMNQSFIQEEKHVLDSSTRPVTNNPELRSETSQPPVTDIVGPASSVASLPSQKPSILGAPGLLSNPMMLGASVRRDNNGSEGDYDMKRRALGIKQSLDLRNQSSIQPPLLPKFPIQTSSSSVVPQGGWLVEEDINESHLNDRPSGTTQESDVIKSDKLRGYQNPFPHTAPGSVSTGLPSYASQVKIEEARTGLDTPKQNVLPTAHLSEIGGTQNHLPSITRELQSEGGKMNLLPSHLSIGVLHEIGRRCGSKVEFRSVVSTSKDLQFSVEVLFTGEKIGVGMGKTRRDAQQQAAELALHNLAEKYVAYIAPRSGAVDRDFNNLSLGTENGFLWDVNPASNEAIKEGFPKDNTSEAAEEPGSNSSSIANQPVEKRANSPRLSESMPSKRSKEGVLRRLGSSLSSSRQPKNEHTIS